MKGEVRILQTAKEMLVDTEVNDKRVGKQHHNYFSSSAERWKTKPNNSSEDKHQQLYQCRCVL